MVKWKMKKNTHTSEAVNHRQYNGQMKNEKEQWYIRSCKSQTMQWSNEKWKRTIDVSLFFFIFHLTIVFFVIYSFWCIIVLFHFSFDHCIVCDLQLLMYQCSFWKLKKNNDTPEAVNHRQCNGQMKNEKEHWYIRSCKSQKMQWSNEKWKRCLWSTASDVSVFFFIFHLTIALSMIYSFWCIIVLFHFSFDHCIFCDLQLLMLKNEKEQWYIRSCKSPKMQWSNEKWKRTLIHQKL
jgi:hypothetical protein